MKRLLLLAFAACHLPFVEPAPRGNTEISLTTAHLDISCSDDEDMPWSGAHHATGVVVSERHVVTAGHAVRCPDLPVARVFLPDGRSWRMAVVEDDLMFGEGRDIAMLELASADTFRLGIAPPRLSPNWVGSVYVSTHGNPSQHGLLYPTNRLIGVEVFAGDSGSPVYTPFGHLVGIVTKRFEGGAVIQRLDTGWSFR